MLSQVMEELPHEVISGIGGSAGIGYVAKKVMRHASNMHRHTHGKSTHEHARLGKKVLGQAYT